MIITCPNCATRYEAPEASFLPNGRRVKCSSCANVWHEGPKTPDDESVGEETTAPPHDVEREAARLAAASRNASVQFANQRAERQINVRGWATLAAMLAVVTFGAYWARVEIVRMFPASAGLYARAGMPVNIRGLEFVQINYEREFENGVPILTVQGAVMNPTSEVLQVPRLRFGLFDEARHEVYHWTMAVGREPLGPRESVTFSTRLAAPPDAARQIQIRFAGELK